MRQCDWPADEWKMYAAPLKIGEKQLMFGDYTYVHKEMNWYNNYGIVEVKEGKHKVHVNMFLNWR